MNIGGMKKLINEARSLNEELWMHSDRDLRVHFGSIDANLDAIEETLRILSRKLGERSMYE